MYVDILFTFISMRKQRILALSHECDILQNDAIGDKLLNKVIHFVFFAHKSIVVAL